MDWGAKANMEEYGQPTPPPYNLTKVTAPVVLFWGENDWLAAPKVKLFWFDLKKNKLLFFSFGFNSELLNNSFILTRPAV